jgi:hypothetical protein
LADGGWPAIDRNLPYKSANGQLPSAIVFGLSKQKKDPWTKAMSLWFF